VLQGRLMLNLDTEDWGEFYLGCAGGLDVNVDRHGAGEPAGRLGGWQIALAGLRGGHSGVDIHEERGNAIKLLVRVLRAWKPACRCASPAWKAAPRATPCPAKPAPPWPCRPARRALAALAAGRPAAERAAGVDEGLRLAASRASEPAAGAGRAGVWLASLHARPTACAAAAWRARRGGDLQQPGHGGAGPDGGHCNFMVRS
jgi:dipeptidase D